MDYLQRRKLKLIKKRQILIKIITCAILICFLLSTLFFSSFFENIININYFNAREKAFKNQSDDYGEYNSASWKVHFVNVGQADSTIVELPDGKIMLIDAGAEDGNYEASKTSLLGVMNEIFYDKPNIIDYLIITHGDSDHYLLIKDVISRYKIENVYRPKILSLKEYKNYQADNKDNANDYYEVSRVTSYNNLIDELNNNFNEGSIKSINFNTKGIKIFDDIYAYSIKMIAPKFDRYSEANDYSAVLLLEINNFKLLLMSDATKSIERDVITSDVLGECEDVDVLKVGHHGSYTSSTIEFLSYCNPKNVIISCREGVYSNIPSKELFENINSLSIQNNCIYRTDINGDIVITENKENEIVCTFSGRTNLHFYDVVFVKWYYIVVVMVTLTFVIFVGGKLQIVQMSRYLRMHTKDKNKIDKE